LAVELLPMSKEAWRGAHRLEDLARIYTMVGEYDAAIDQLCPFQCSGSTPPGIRCAAIHGFKRCWRARTSRVWN
jgi:hypothetical protein